MLNTTAGVNVAVRLCTYTSYVYGRFAPNASRYATGMRIGEAATTKRNAAEAMFRFHSTVS